MDKVCNFNPVTISISACNRKKQKVNDLLEKIVLFIKEILLSLKNV